MLRQGAETNKQTKSTDLVVQSVQWNQEVQHHQVAQEVQLDQFGQGCLESQDHPWDLQQESIYLICDSRCIQTFTYIHST